MREAETVQVGSSGTHYLTFYAFSQDCDNPILTASAEQVNSVILALEQYVPTPIPTPSSEMIEQIRNDAVRCGRWLGENVRVGGALGAAQPERFAPAPVALLAVLD